MSSIALTQNIGNQVLKAALRPRFFLTINGTDFSSYLSGQSVQASRQYGVASAVINLSNDGRFSRGGANEIKVGDVISLKAAYKNGQILFNIFYGIVNQRSNEKSASGRTITLTCLDYVSKLKFTDINLDIEGTKIEVTEEVLDPQYLPAPNDTFAQIFNFGNDSIAQNPPPVILIRNVTAGTDDPFDGKFTVIYDTGQLKLGAPLNTDNYQIIARSYYTYVQGVKIEEAIEQLIYTVDNYGNYIFGESSSNNVIINHLEDTIQNVTKSSLDAMTPNYTEETIIIEKTLASTYDPNASGGAPTSIELTEGTGGLPTSGTGTINGDTFTWSGKTSTHLTGLPTTGENALTYHEANLLVKYEATYAVGQVWYTSFNRIVTDMTAGDFTIPGGTFSYLDKYSGRIILTAAISLATAVKCNTNYRFRTLQKTGVEINGIKFREREVENRWDALQNLLQYLPPNQVIMTTGDDKIWLKTLRQSTTADYNLTLVQSMNLLEDEDLFTRVRFYGKNINPTNILFNEDVDFVTTGQSFKALASVAELTYAGTNDGWHEFDSAISNAGYIALEAFKPIVYINGIQVSDEASLVSLSPIKIGLTERTETKTQSQLFKGTKTSTSTYYYYKVYFPHQSLDPNSSIYCYDSTGVRQVTISANDPNMDYARGVWTAPGSAKNETIETLSTATYYIFYGTDSIDIDYDNVKVYIRSNILPEPAQALVEATFEYYTSMTSQVGIQYVIDGRYDTQVQTEFYAEPPSGYPYAILDLGANYNIQALDIIVGFFRPDEYRKLDVDLRLTLKYSTDNVTYYNISDATTSFSAVSGEGISFEEKDLGTDFTARYIKIDLENVGKVDYKNGVWPVAFTEIAAYGDIVLSSNATLITTSNTSTAFVNGVDTDIIINSTTGFDDNVGYISNGVTMDAFTFTSKTATHLQNVQFDSGHTTSYGVGVRVAAELESDTTTYDDDEILPKLGDRVYKKSFIDDNVLFDQTRIDTLAKLYLKEFIKNHSKATVSVLFAPYIQVGQTLYVVDAHLGMAENYFVEEVNYSGNFMDLTIARYPAN